MQFSNNSGRQYINQYLDWNIAIGNPGKDETTNFRVFSLEIYCNVIDEFSANLP